MERQNITLSLPKELLQKAKILAVKNNTSLSKLLSDYIARITDEDEAYHAARGRHLRILKSGYDLGLDGKPLSQREDLHER